MIWGETPTIFGNIHIYILYTGIFLGNPEELGPMLSNLGHYFLMITDRLNKKWKDFAVQKSWHLGASWGTNGKIIETQNGFMSFIEKLHFFLSACDDLTGALCGILRGGVWALLLPWKFQGAEFFGVYTWASSPPKCESSKFTRSSWHTVFMVQKSHSQPPGIYQTL